MLKVQNLLKGWNSFVNSECLNQLSLDPKGFSFTFSVIFSNRTEKDVHYLWGYSRPSEMKGLSPAIVVEP